MSSSLFQVGQRWANTAETEMGVGIITQVSDRMVGVFFPDAEQARQYAVRNAPLARIEFQPGDRVETADGQAFVVLAREERNGLHFYDLESDNGERRVSVETQLRGCEQQSAPLTRLLQGQNDSVQNFSLRLNTWQVRGHTQSLDVAGLLGGRVSLIDHQFHIADTVTRQRHPRVMLADEVGLGKTIEAGLITHRLLQTGQIERVLILVPDSLAHQWLVEMRRRFNLAFRLFDDEQCNAICESQDTDNPFTTEQWVLCPIDLLAGSERWRQAALDAGWDLLIVDEAHHLAWHPDHVSDRYALVEGLAKAIPGLLLLTATPEKEGHISHFAQLRLLDPDRYHAIEAFIEQQTRFAEVAALAERLFDATPLTSDERARLDGWLPDAGSQQLIDALVAAAGEHPELQRRLADRLIDRHGTGRALFRNTRAAIPGFPSRQLHPVMLAMPEAWASKPARDFAEGLTPEVRGRGDAWLSFDPRVAWLIDLLKKQRAKKFLVLCHHDDTALALGEHLSLRGGVMATTFHRDMTLIERDRAAAWFADSEGGAQVLVCSEIGSEGRNFQFCHQLVLFDLPLPVDLLEQRIGRLDRIGQSRDIQIHVPLLENSAQTALFRFYHEGLDAFLTSRASHTIVHDERIAELQRRWSAAEPLEAFLADTRQRVAALDDEFRHGRNRLLELHSRGNPDATARLLQQIREEDEPTRLTQWMTSVCTQLGIEEEDLSDTHVLLKPGPNFEESQLGYLDEDGMAVTFDRDTALTRDDVTFLSWDHPFVQAAQDLILTSGRGSACLALLKNRQIKEGTLLLETVFAVECLAPRHLQLQRYLPATPVRVLLDQARRNLSTSVSSDTLDRQLKTVKGELVGPLIQQVKNELPPLIAASQRLAEQHAASLVEAALARFEQAVGDELARLDALQTEGAPVTDQDRTTLQQRLVQGRQLLREKTRVQLDAIRLAIAVA